MRPTTLYREKFTFRWKDHFTNQSRGTHQTAQHTMQAVVIVMDMPLFVRSSSTLPSPSERNSAQSGCRRGIEIAFERGQSTSHPNFILQCHSLPNVFPIDNVHLKVHIFWQMNTDGMAYPNNLIANLIYFQINSHF